MELEQGELCFCIILKTIYQFFTHNNSPVEPNIAYEDKVEISQSLPEFDTVGSCE